MTDRTTPWPAGTPCWVDVTVSDIARSQDFYGRLFGWTFTGSAAEFGGYTNALKDGKAVAGLSPVMEGWGGPSPWIVYLATDDILETASAALAGGATPVFPPMEVADFGWMGVWKDPAGSAFGLWQSNRHTGFNLVDAPGAPAWCDLTSPDYEGSRDFYTGLFGYRYTEMPPGDVPYSLLTLPDGTVVGGVGGESPENRFSGWAVAFQVDDVNGAAAKVAELGGRVLDQPSDFEFGRMVTVSGPDQELFMLFAPGE